MKRKWKKRENGMRSLGREGRSLEKGGAKSWGIGGKKEEMGRREELGGGWQCERKKQGSREGRMRVWEEGEERIKYWEKGRAGGEAGKRRGTQDEELSCPLHRRILASTVSLKELQEKKVLRLVQTWQSRQGPVSWSLL